LLQFLKKLTPCLLLIVVSCTSTENNIDKNQNIEKINIKKIASEKFGDNYSLDYNSSKEFVICKSKSKIAGNNPLEYFIFDLVDGKIIETKVIPLGNVSWQSNFEVKVEIHPGMIQKNTQNSSGYILNVKTNSKTKLGGGVN
jgi:hypothetical protein